MEIIHQAKRVTQVFYRRIFDYRSSRGHGFSFECDASGVISDLSKRPAAADNLRDCLSGELDVIDKGVQKFEHSYREPAIGRCSCGCEVMLDGFTNTCSCGRDYNGSGQLLAPREQWGEETGETAADILCGSAEDY